MKGLLLATMVANLVATVGHQAQAKPIGEFSIANRGGSLTILEKQKDASGEIHVHGDVHTTEISEPMYVSPLGTSKGQRLITFADRTRNKLSVLDGKTKALLSEIELSKGAFHQFSHPLVGLKVAVATDIEKGMDLITVSNDGKSLTKKHFTIPEALMSGNPHDVIMDRKFAYLTVKGVQGQYDALLQIDVNTLKIVNARRFSKDIHLFNPVKANFFAVVEEVTGDLHLIQKGSLTTINKLNVAQGIHGISGSENGKFLIVADINEPAGKPAIHAVEVLPTGLKIVSSVALNFPTAHNVAVDDRTSDFDIIVTHSGGAQTQNSVLKFSTKSKKLSLEKDVRTGPNPFGLTFF